MAAGCCPNENALSDFFNIPLVAFQLFLEDASALGQFFFGTPNINILDPATIPADDKSCIDNHGGRQCQEVLVGDVSLDLTDGGKGGIGFPGAAEITVTVEPDEKVSFVLHNNGCFGNTVVSATQADIGGTLGRTHREFAISPVVNAAPTNATPKLQTSTDPLLGGAPTAGTNQNLVSPALLDVTPVSSGNSSFGGSSVTILHSEIDNNVAANTGNFSRYRYFADVSLEYCAPSEGNTGDVDRFVFCVDDCEVAVTFEMDNSDPELATFLQPSTLNFDNSLTEVCPQTVGTFRIRNQSEEAANFEVQVPQDASSRVGNGPNTFSVDIESGQLAPNGDVEITVLYNCTRPGPFEMNIPVRTFRASDGSNIDLAQLQISGNVVNLTGTWEGTYNLIESRGGCTLNHAGNLDFRVSHNNTLVFTTGSLSGHMDGLESRSLNDCSLIGTFRTEIHDTEALFERGTPLPLDGYFDINFDRFTWSGTVSADGNTITGAFTNGSGSWAATKISDERLPINF